MYGVFAQCPDFHQNWTQADKETFWTRTQGSRLIKKDTFLNLNAKSGQPFHTTLAEYGFIRFKAENRLPIGFSEHSIGNDTAIGLTCSACHTRVIRINGQDCILEGAPAMIDFERFLTGLQAALATAKSDDSIRRTQSLLSHYISDGAAAGPGRVDAFGHIFNRLITPTNGKQVRADAPVSYPALWYAPHYSHVQWTASNNHSTPRGADLRNVGEALGVFADFRYGQNSAPQFVESSVHIGNLRELEKLVRNLNAPKFPWPINSKLAATGEVIFEKRCTNCHPRFDDKSVKLAMSDSPSFTRVPVETHNVGTEPLVARRVAKRMTDESQYNADVCNTPAFFDLFFAKKNSLCLPRPGRELLAVAIGSALNQNGGVSGAMHTVGSLLSPTAVLALTEAVVQIPKDGAYIGRPLRGVWATGPYLHNGSVPNVRALLSGVRPGSFKVGCKEYEQANLGFATDCKEGFSFNTALTGNKNDGHRDVPLHGNELEAVLEYLKTL
jgi:hypothetical protein